MESPLPEKVEDFLEGDDPILEGDFGCRFKLALAEAKQAVVGGVDDVESWNTHGLKVGKTDEEAGEAVFRTENFKGDQRRYKGDGIAGAFASRMATSAIR